MNTSFLKKKIKFTETQSILATSFDAFLISVLAPFLIHELPPTEFLECFMLTVNHCKNY